MTTFINLSNPIAYTVTETSDECEAWAMSSIELLQTFGNWSALNEAVDQALHYWGEDCKCGYPECGYAGCMSHQIHNPGRPIVVQAHFLLPIVSVS